MANFFSQKADGKALDSSATNDPSTLRLIVRAPYKTYYDDMIYSLSAVNATGPFDILPKHHNFMSILKSGELNINGVNGRQKIIISGGLLVVKPDQISLFLNV